MKVVIAVTKSPAPYERSVGYYVSGSPGWEGIAGTFAYAWDIDRARVYASPEDALDAIYTRNSKPGIVENVEYALVPVEAGATRRLT